MDIHVRDIRAGNWHWAENAVLDQYGAQLGPYGLAVYYCLCRFASQAGETHVSQERIAERIGCSVRQVKREIIALRDAGLILVDEHKDARGMNTAATYSLVGLATGRASQSPRDASQSTARGQRRRALQFMDKNSMDKNSMDNNAPPHEAQDAPERDDPLAAVWAVALCDLREQIPPANVARWLGRAALVAAEDGTAVLACPDQATAEQLRRRYDALVRQAVGDALGRPVVVEYRADGDR